MMMFIDLNLNQFEDSVRMSLKRTIVEHELIFKDQVHELHRLYWTQKNLMRELYRKELEAKALSQSQMLTMGSAKEGNVDGLEEAEGKFIDASGNRHRGFIRNSAKISMVDEVIRPGYSGAKVAIDEKRGGVIEKGENSYCYEIIDLEGPVDNGFKIPRANCEVMGSSRSDNVSDMASSSRVQNEAGFVLDLNSLQSDCSEQWREHKADEHSGTGGSESSVADGSTSSSHKQDSNSSEPMLIDLNIPQDDEFSLAVNDPMITCSSPSPSSSVVQYEGLRIDQCSNRNLKEISAALNSGVPHSAFMGKSRDHLLPGCNGSQRSHVSAFGGKHDNKVEGSESKDLTECCGKSVEGFPNIVAVDDNNIEDKLANNMTNEDGPDEFLTERKSNGLSGNTACTSSEKIIEENSETTPLDYTSLVEEQECRHDEEDHAVIDAANVLAGISSSQPSSQLEQLFNNKKDQPEYSSDSFETMTLEQPEVKSHEQHLVMRTRQTGKETEEEIAASRVNNKLRRGLGRAVRGFQKDVLPGMVSLSRHEICEDMHSIGYELRKNGSRRGNCFVPVKSGRSRRLPIRQRR